MTKRRKIMLWIGLLLSFPASGFACNGAMFYAWLSAANPEKWTREKAGIWSFSALAFAIAFFVLFFYCAVSLVKDFRKNH